ncbi:anaerobic ribonucleoside-triphosphate reductase [Facklamia miroungae]|uniref:Ribonucleoside-triphosphate reductase n=1 Tax=Facklamia miroungae TaxID=120956 RepID=A0A1G7QRH4_9LACT|nr:anaerobic ribonucleoside-triphosphate reductase [Facklamia miroungae]NKZ29021.1 anaerobic ribonucleoside-triphosphate reductase [Facklamia miroungae]SDG00479.1 ribonucleoside-triphosphate reductase [Facklamia miroungae]
MDRTVAFKKRKSTLITIKVKKRDGSVEKFIWGKLKWSLKKALNSQDEHVIEAICQVISEQLVDLIDSSEIKQVIVEELIKMGRETVADEYLAYAEAKLENYRSQMQLQDRMNQLIKRDPRLVNENANKDSRVFNTLRDLTCGVTAKAIGLNMLPKQVANGHLKGSLHFHDLDYSPYSPMTNCCLIDIETMLKHGFHIGNAEVESPRSINTATAQIAQIIANVSSCQYGGCSIDRIDEVLAPYADLNFQKNIALAKELTDDQDQAEAFAKNKTQKDIYDAMQSLEYEINTLYSSNGQTPFTTLGFGLGTSWYAREIQKAILKIRLKGLGKEHRTAIFPKLVFTLRKGTNLMLEDPNYDIKQLALKCACNRMYPDVLMYDKIKELTGSFKVPMGCRSFLQGWQDESGKEVNSGRMNLGVVTLNLPRIAIESDHSFENFWDLLKDRLEIVGQALIYRAKRVKEAKTENAPILYREGAFGHYLGAEDEVDQLFKNKRATLSLGYIGLYEITAYFYGSNWEQNQLAKAFSLEVIQTLKKKADQLADQYGYHFSVYSTPSESLTDRFCRLDQAKFGSVEDITDKDYYTNSFHYDVRKSPNPFEKIDFEKDYAPFTSGGFIHYCEYPNLRQNPKALETVWDYAYDKIGYLGTNTPIDRCYECGFQGEFNPTERGFSCPQCNNRNPETCDVVKRTCGYLGNPNIRPMVKGRHKEIRSRKKHLTERMCDE